MAAEVGEVLWTPPADVRKATRMGQFLDWIEQRHGVELLTYDDAWRWSVNNLGDFWGGVAEFMDVRFFSEPRTVVEDERMPGTVWFPGATLNYAEHVLRWEGDAVALAAHSEARKTVELTRADLRARVGAVRAGLRRLGVGRGDRVAAYLPNSPEAVVALLATASLGAIWTICSPEFGSKGAIDRLAQTEPKVLLVADGYRYGGRNFERSTEAAEIRDALPGLQATVWLRHLGQGDPLPGSIPWEELEAEAGPLDYEPVAFDHPLYILYSSGTTGQPKPIVLGHGGMLLQHLTCHGLQDDIREGDRFFWYSSTSWMAWNLGVSALLCGATLVTWDGAPNYPDLESFWKFVGRERITYLGTSPAFLHRCRSEGVIPSQVADLSSIRTINSGGSPLPAEMFRQVYEVINPDLYLQSASGGTDVGSAILGGCRLVPVRAGEIACRMLGADVHAFGPDGKPVVGERGEFVITKPMPCMLVGFWGDDDGSRLRETYFSRYPGVWWHGDWITFTERGTCVITGRSDATLNRGGVRLGTSEFYSVVEGVDGIEDSLIVHLEDPHGGLGELILFVNLQEGRALDDALRRTVNDALRDELSPRHVPDAIHVVPAIPRTVTGKKMEIPVKRILQGFTIQQAASLTSLAVPGSLDPFVAIARGEAPERLVQT